MDMFLSDFDSYSESSSSDDQEDDEFTYSGHASCILSNLDETIEKIDDFLLFERRYVHGDVVFSVKDPFGKMGRVINIEIFADLKNHYEKKLKNIDSKKLQKIRSVSTGDYVVTGPWVGRADQVTDSVTVLFDDGAKCEITMAGLEKLEPVSPDDDLQYYPGQRVRAVGPSSPNRPRWFCGARDETQHEGTVCSVNAGSVHVTWLGCALFGSEPVRAPPALQSSKDLTPVSCFSNSHWQIGDWCAIPDTGPGTGPRPGPTGFEEIFVIEKIKSKVDVLWQDGSESCGLDPNSLGPVNSLDAHEFWPHQFVLEKGVSEDQKWGFVKIVDPKEKIVSVKWALDGDEETISVYELIDHPDYSYSQGDLVFRLNIKDTDKGYSDFYLSHIGIVIGFKDGFVEVKWAAGFISKVFPQEILRVEKTEAVSATPLPNDDIIEPNNAKSDHDDHSPDPKEKDFSDSDDDNIKKDCLKTLYDSITFNVPRVAIGFLSGVAARLFGSMGYGLLPASSGENKEDAIETHSESTLEDTEESKGILDILTSENPKEVRQFDMVTDCSNHQFVDNPGKYSVSSQVNRSWLKKVQQEWRILANDLPETIYVRVFEERMDLLHAALIGAPGTPYHDGLFFFDFFLPPEYPHEPPMVHYHSGGLRVNPNLYESGRVCLSLLNTWTGTGTETWNPKGSTILQVLVSLQALVLNQNPYFNEAGYEQQLGSAEGEKNSCTYNENAFLMSCKSMLYVLRMPPKHFEALVEEHFSKRCVSILMACKAYLEGVPIGCAAEGQKGNSTGFKIMLSKLIPKLVEAFVTKGFDCGEYVQMGKYNMS